jgi:hypothetical protein
MKWFAKSALIAACLVIVCAIRVRSQEPAGKAEDLRLPLEYYENGTIKSQLFAKAAEPGEHAIEARELRVEFYDRNGQIEMRVLADDCAYDRKHGRIETRSAVRMDAQGVTITGKGLNWTVDRKCVEILSEVKVVLARRMGSTSLKQLEKKNPKEGTP